MTTEEHLQLAWRELDAVRRDRDNLRAALSAVADKAQYKADSEYWLQEVCGYAKTALEKSK